MIDLSKLRALLEKYKAKAADPHGDPIYDIIADELEDLLADLEAQL